MPNVETALNNLLAEMDYSNTKTTTTESPYHSPVKGLHKTALSSQYPGHQAQSAEQPRHSSEPARTLKAINPLMTKVTENVLSAHASAPEQESKVDESPICVDMQGPPLQVNIALEGLKKPVVTTSQPRRPISRSNPSTPKQ